MAALGRAAVGAGVERERRPPSMSRLLFVGLGPLGRRVLTDLFARIPHGSGQTYLRELLLVADHNAYHVGQLVALRRRLGAWPG